MCRALWHWRQIFPWTFSWIFLWFRLVWYSFRQYLCKTELFGNSIILGIMRRVAGVVWQSSEQAWSIQTVSCCGRYVRRRSLNDSCSYWHDSNTHTPSHKHNIRTVYLYYSIYAHSLFNLIDALMNSFMRSNLNAIRSLMHLRSWRLVDEFVVSLPLRLWGTARTWSNDERNRWGQTRSATARPGFAVGTKMFFMFFYAFRSFSVHKHMTSSWFFEIDTHWMPPTHTHTHTH